MTRPRLAAPWALVVALFFSPGLQAGDFPFASVQAAIDAASPGDVIDVPAGVWVGDVDFGGKAVTVRGAGVHTVLQGTGSGPVVTFQSGEGSDSVLDSVTVTGGRASSGGGVLIDGASPTLVRCTIVGNRAMSSGSGIQVRGGGTPLIFNNVVSFNGRDGPGDPHGIQVSSSAPALVNNTIVRNDSNGIFLSGDAPATVVGNLIAWNGSRVGGTARGRGICDFSGGQSTLRNNLFHKNRVSAILRSGKDWRRIAAFQKQNPDDTGVEGNVDGNPGYFRRPPKDVAALSCLDLLVCDTRPGRAVDAGCEDAGCEDLDGSRNTVGHGGGPFATGSRDVPDVTACGVGG